MVEFENGTLIKGAYVEINGVQYEVHAPEIQNNTPVSADNLNKLQTDILGAKVTKNDEDIDSYTKAGMYYFSSEHIPVNAPKEELSGWLKVISNSETEIKQIWIDKDSDDIYVRRKIKTVVEDDTENETDTSTETEETEIFVWTEWKKWNSELKIIQRKINNASISSNGYLYFNIDDLKEGTIDDFIEFESNGLIKFKKACTVEINCNVWIGSSNGQSRPWMQLKDYTNDKVLAEVIDDNSSTLTTLNINNYPLKTVENQEVGIFLDVNESSVINQASGRQNSYINIKVLG